MPAEKLVERGDHRIRLRAHDLRATFVTLALAEGRSEDWVVTRTGHGSSQMIALYRRQAKTAAELKLGWTNGQGLSERMAAQVLFSDGYESIDPSHPLGGPDGGKDAICRKDGKTWVMAVYFPRGQQPFTAIKKKLGDDLRGVAGNGAHGLAFVTNQELTHGEREALKAAAGNVPMDLHHLERITAILDKPSMAPVRAQFLGITSETEVLDAIADLKATQTGGPTFCYIHLNTDLRLNAAHCLSIVKQGKYPLSDLGFRISDLHAQHFDLYRRDIGAMSVPAMFWQISWPLPESAYYRVHFHARNGTWNQDLLLRRSEKAGCWVTASRVNGEKGEVRFTQVVREFLEEFGDPVWRT